MTKCPSFEASSPWWYRLQVFKQTGSGGSGVGAEINDTHSTKVVSEVEANPEGSGPSIDDLTNEIGEFRLHKGASEVHLCNSGSVSV